MIIDLANFSVVPTPEQVAQLRGLGVTLAVVGASYGTVADAQIAALETGGVPCEAYEFPGALRDSGRAWWLDAETSGATVAGMRAIFDGPVRPVGVYTRRGWWTANTGDWDVRGAYPWLRLWDADYVHGAGPCQIEVALPEHLSQAIDNERAMIQPFVPYGGFTRRDRVQWHDSVRLFGVDVDLSEEEGMNTEEKAAFAAVLAQLAALGTKIDNLQALMRAALAIDARTNPDIAALVRYLGG